MGALAPSHWILLLLVIVLLFGTGRLSSVMGDFAKGIKAFKKNMNEDADVSMEETARDKPASLTAQQGTATAARETSSAHHG